MSRMSSMIRMRHGMSWLNIRESCEIGFQGWLHKQSHRWRPPLPETSQPTRHRPLPLPLKDLHSLQDLKSSKSKEHQGTWWEPDQNLIGTWISPTVGSLHARQRSSVNLPREVPGANASAGTYLRCTRMETQKNVYLACITWSYSDTDKLYHAISDYVRT